MTKRVIFAILTLIFTAAQAYRTDSDNPKAYAAITKPHSQQLYGDRKPVYLMKLKLTRQQIQGILDYQPKPSLKLKDDHLPSRVVIGMNGTPVLYQGHHGDCVIFALTGAIDALLGKGDYVSQLCHLELASYLQEHSQFYVDGWSGSDPHLELAQILQMGIVSTEKQRNYSCAGVREYPIEADNFGNSMSLDEYKQLAEPVMKPPSGASDFMSQELLTLNDRILGLDANPNPANPKALYDGNKTLHELKTFLAKVEQKSQPGNLIGISIFATILPVDYCFAGACATTHQKYDTWALTDAIDHLGPSDFAGHEMIIIGYDDNAVAYDQDNKPHKGLLILRNSWGDDVGDGGNFYMTYDFFKKFVLEADMLFKPKY